MDINFGGVFPAITTPFREDGGIDYDLMVQHAGWMLAEGCHGIIPCGSLGESATLTSAEKVECVRALRAGLGPEVPIVPGVAALSTPSAVGFAKEAEEAGANGFMVLPPYAYSTDWREMKAHVRAVIRATGRPCILYNNPVAYKTDFLPEHVAVLADECPNLVAVKESSADVRRIMALRALLGDRLTLMVGVDDLIVEAMRMGATGWVAGLVNAFPRESVELWRRVRDGETEGADELYAWFLPLLRLDTVPKFVQLIKLCQERVGMGSARVRPPRLELVRDELTAALAVIDAALATRVQA